MHAIDSVCRVATKLKRSDMAHPNSVDDSDWPEVRFINGYAMLIGFLRMGVRGLSVLVFTWATVVLLGGFVTDLGKTEFWCLTMITLIQTFSAGVFNVPWKETLNTKQNSWNVLLTAVYTMAKDMTISIKERRKWLLLEFLLQMLQLVALALVLCPLVVVYLVGLYISTGIALWRLIARDYISATGGANLTPALDVLYSLAVAQGAFLSYKNLYAWVKGVGLVEEVASSYSLDANLISEYLDETVRGCTKDPMFTRGRNLFTYAVDLLMGSNKFNETNLSGVQILGTMLQRSFNHGQVDMMKQLMTRSASFSHIIQRLMKTMDIGSAYSSEIKGHAATIVVQIADRIRLRYFPGGIQFLSSLLNIVDDYMWLHSKHVHARPEPTSPSPEIESNNPIHACNWLVVQGMRIILNLTADDDNFRIIIETQGLIPKITAPLISHKLHRDHHGEWSEIAEESLKLMRRLMAAPEETGEKFRSKISSNKEAISSTIGIILQCHKCQLSLKMKAVEIILFPSEDTSRSIMACGSSSRIFIWILLLIFLLTDDHLDETRGSTHQIKMGSNYDIRSLAGEKLSAVMPLQTEGSDTSTLQSVHVLDNLIGALVEAGSISNSVHAAKILRYLCLHYNKDDGYLKKLKEATIDVMPKVLNGILGYGWTREANDSSETGGISQCYGQGDTSSSHQQSCEQCEGSEQLEALISLCRTIRWLWYEKYPDTARQLNCKAKNICIEHGKPVKHFPELVNEAKELLEKKKAKESVTTVDIVLT